MPVDRATALENPEPVGNHGFDRSHNMFDSYKNTQAQAAQEKLNEILGGRNISNSSDQNYFDLVGKTSDSSIFR